MKTTKESEQKFRKIFGDSPIGIELYDRKGNLLEVNKASLKIFGVSDASNFLNYNFFEDPNTPENIKENLNNGKITRFEKIYDFNKIKSSHFYETSKSGTIFHDVLISPLFLKDSNQYSHFIVQIQDITLKKLSEEKIKSSEERFRRMADNIHDGLTIIEQGEIIYINDRACEILGYPREELIKMSGIDLAAPEEKERIKNFMVDIKNEIIPLKEFEYWILRKDGTRRYIHNRYSLAKKEDLISRFVVTTDITDRRLAQQKLKESEENYRNLINHLSDLIIKMELNGTLTYASPQIFDILGYKEEDLIGLNNLTLIHPDDLPNLIKIMNEAVKSNTQLFYEFRVKHKDGHYVPVASSGSTLKEEGKIKLIGVLSDISERKKAEKLLRESEIKYRLAYNKADFYKDLFAHDMNNILHNILSSIELYSLCQKYPDKLDKGEELLGIIKAQAKRGKDLISNVQKLSMLEKTEFHNKKVDICDYLKNAIKFVKKSYQDRNIYVLFESIDEIFYVRANELLLDVFENILINSVKYNNNQSVIINILISREIKDKKKYVKLQILDNGIGIPDSRKEAIFNRNYNKDRTVMGLGIGLSLVKSIIYSYNGYITVEDKEIGDHTKGSKFIIYIPEAQ